MTQTLPDGARVSVGDPDAWDVALAWAADEGWRPGRHDATAFAAADPGGVLAVRRDGRIVTTLSAVRYDDTFGFIGLFITDPRDRGRGFGRALWARGTQRLAEVASVGLDGVVERESLYASLGFRRAHLSQRWVAPGDRVSARPPAPGIVDAGQVGADALGDYERRSRAFPARRVGFLRAWLALPESHARAAVADDGTVRGYGVVRRCTTGAKVAPLFADDPGTAAALLDDLLGLGAEWGAVSIDVPDPNEAGVDLVRARGMRPEFACVRMYSGAQPDIDVTRVFGFTSFELG